MSEPGKILRDHRIADADVDHLPGAGSRVQSLVEHPGCLPFADNSAEKVLHAIVMRPHRRLDLAITATTQRTVNDMIRVVAALQMRRKRAGYHANLLRRLAHFIRQ